MIPENIEQGDESGLNLLSDYIQKWIRGQVPQKAVKEIQDLFADGIGDKKDPEEKMLEEKFEPENFDLIAWFVVTK